MELEGERRGRIDVYSHLQQWVRHLFPSSSPPDHEQSISFSYSNQWSMVGVWWLHIGWIMDHINLLPVTVWHSQCALCRSLQTEERSGCVGHEPATMDTKASIPGLLPPQVAVTVCSAPQTTSKESWWWLWTGIESRYVCLPCHHWQNVVVDIACMYSTQPPPPTSN